MCFVMKIKKYMRITKNSNAYNANKKVENDSQNKMAAPIHTIASY